MYPMADVPVFQLSLDHGASSETHYKWGRQLRSLRDLGVLILRSGNVVHNLTRIKWDRVGGLPWADEFDLYFNHNIFHRIL